MTRRWVASGLTFYTTDIFVNSFLSFHGPRLIDLLAVESLHFYLGDSTSALCLMQWISSSCCIPVDCFRRKDDTQK